MKLITKKYLFTSLLFVTFTLAACNSEVNNDLEIVQENKSTPVDTTVITETKNVQDDTVNLITSIPQEKTKVNSSKKEPKTNSTATYQPMEPDIVPIKEEDYLKWRVSEYCINDSIGQRKSLYNKWKYAYPNMDSTTKGIKWKTHWNNYIQKKEKNVIWNNK